MTDFIKMYSGIVEKCFVSCCNDFTSKSLSAKEVRNCVHWEPHARVLSISQDACISNCADKLLKHAERVGARFAEQNAGA